MIDGPTPIEQARADTIPGAFRRAARLYGDREALQFADRQWTHRSLDVAADRVASHLVARGCKPGDRIVAYGRNSDAYFIAWLACSRAGLVHVPANYAYRPSELDYIVCQSGASGILFDAALSYAALACEAVSALPLRLVLDSIDVSAASILDIARDHAVATSFPDPSLTSETLAQILYTSGTTGAAKGAMMSHGAFTTEYLGCAVACDYGEDDIVLAALPLYHTAQMHAFTSPQMLAGARTILIQSPEAATVLELIERHAVTSFFAPPTVWTSLLRHPDFDLRDLSSLAKLYYGAAIMPVPILEEIRKRLPAAGLYNLYGQSEIGPVATVLRPEEHGDRPTSAGRPMLSVDTRVVDEAMNDVAIGVHGEIVHRSRQLMTGYWDKPEETAEAFAGGWFHSGDIGVLDEAGYLYVVDRLKDVINTGGVLVSSREVEDVLLRHPAVSEVAVVSVADPKWVEAVAAVIVLRDGKQATDADLIDHARVSLAPFKLPKQIFFADSLPRNTAGKILKRELRLRFSGDADMPGREPSPGQ